jgi:triosephosphate isomerase (TIM)
MSHSSRKPIIAGNWKLNKTIKEAIELVTLLKRQFTDADNVEIVVCPPFTALSEVSEILMESGIKLGAQDIFWEETGAFTGEVSATLVKDAGAQFVIVGHSERRQFFHETDETVYKKITAALKLGLKPIVCVGETLAEREAGQTFSTIQKQLSGAFSKLSAKDLEKMVIAYEPVWAIGTGKVATPQQAQEVHAFIRKQITLGFDAESARVLRILYGGSVKPENISSLMTQEDIDGALVGGASLDAKGFSQIVQNTLNAVLNKG